MEIVKISLFFVTCGANTIQTNTGKYSTRNFYGNSTNKTFSEASYREYAYNTNAANTRYPYSYSNAVTREYSNHAAFTYVYSDFTTRRYPDNNPNTKGNSNIDYFTRTSWRPFYNRTNTPRTTNSTFWNRTRTPSHTKTTISINSTRTSASRTSRRTTPTAASTTNTVLPKILGPPKLKTNISSGSHCLESFIHREEGDVSIISVCRAAGWDRFYILSVVESLMRMTGWLTGKKEIATIQILMTNANITRNRPQSLGRLT